MKYCFLSKEQQLKRCYFQLSNQFHLPMDIIKMIYMMNKKENMKKIEEMRLFYKNILLMKMVDTPGNMNIIKDTLLNKWNEKYKDIETRLLIDDIYQYRIPYQRGCEWAIKVTALKSKCPDPHFQMIKMIEIIGEENYLLKKKNTPCINDNFPGDITYIEPCDKQLKIKYLNTNSWDEIIDDYNNFLNFKNTEHHNAWRIIVEPNGESSFL